MSSLCRTNNYHLVAMNMRCPIENYYHLLQSKHFQLPVKPAIKTMEYFVKNNRFPYIIRNLDVRRY